MTPRGRHALPRSVTRLLERYQRAHGRADIRLWRLEDEAWTCLVPEEGAGIP